MGFPTCSERRKISNYGYGMISQRSVYFYKYNSDIVKRYLVISFFGSISYSGYIEVQASYDDLYELFNKKQNLSVVAIVFIIVGSVVFFIILIILIICCKKRKINNTAVQPNTVVNNSPSDNCAETLFPANPVYPSPY